MPQADPDLCYLQASQLLSLYRQRKLSPVEVVTAQIARCEAVNPQLNALTYTFFDRALEQAREAERRYVSGDRLRPLEGLSLAIKDFHPVAGEITTFGSHVHDGFRPDYTAPTVARL